MHGLRNAADVPRVASRRFRGSLPGQRLPFLRVAFYSFSGVGGIAPEEKPPALPENSSTLGNNSIGSDASRMATDT